MPAAAGRGGRSVPPSAGGLGGSQYRH